MTLSGLRPSVLNVLYEYEKTFFVVRSGAMRRQERKLASSEAARLNIVPFPDIAQKVEIIYKGHSPSLFVGTFELFYFFL